MAREGCADPARRRSARYCYPRHDNETIHDQQILVAAKRLIQFCATNRACNARLPPPRPADHGVYARERSWRCSMPDNTHRIRVPGRHGAAGVRAGLVCGSGDRSRGGQTMHGSSPGSVLAVRLLLISHPRRGQGSRCAGVGGFHQRDRQEGDGVPKVDEGDSARRCVNFKPRKARRAARC